VEAEVSSETMVPLSQCTGRFNPEDSTLTLGIMYCPVEVTAEPEDRTRDLIPSSPDLTGNSSQAGNKFGETMEITLCLTYERQSRVLTL
jgi:hypothetical protein